VTQSVLTIKSFAFTNGRARRMRAATVSGVSTGCVAEANVHGRHTANAVERAVQRFLAPGARLTAPSACARAMISM